MSKPCNIIYRNGRSLQRIIRLVEGDYYAMLGDFGMSYDIPIAFLSRYAVRINVSISTRRKELCIPLGSGRLNFVSDLNRLINETKIQPTEHSFMIELCDVYEQIGQHISTIQYGEQDLINQFKHKEKLYNLMLPSIAQFFGYWATGLPYNILTTPTHPKALEFKSAAQAVGRSYPVFDLEYFVNYLAQTYGANTAGSTNLGA